MERCWESKYACFNSWTSSYKLAKDLPLKVKTISDLQPHNIGTPPLWAFQHFRHVRWLCSSNGTSDKQLQVRISICDWGLKKGTVKTKGPAFTCVLEKVHILSVICRFNPIRVKRWSSMEAGFIQLHLGKQRQEDIKSESLCPFTGWIQI